MSLTERIRETYGRDCIRLASRQIQVYWLRDGWGRDYTPERGGPLVGGPPARTFGAAARESAARLAGRIEEGRHLLPERVQGWPVVYGAVDFRGEFHPAG